MYIKFDYALGIQNDPPLRTTFDELNKKIEYTSELIHFALLKFTIAGIEMPTLLVTIINYFVYDLKDDSYLLPFAIM